MSLNFRKYFKGEDSQTDGLTHRLPNRETDGGQIVGRMDGQRDKQKANKRTDEGGNYERGVKYKG